MPHGIHHIRILQLVRKATDAFRVNDWTLNQIDPDGLRHVATMSVRGHWFVAGRLVVEQRGAMGGAGLARSSPPREQPVTLSNPGASAASPVHLRPWAFRAPASTLASSDCPCVRASFVAHYWLVVIATRGDQGPTPASLMALTRYTYLAPAAMSVSVYEVASLAVSSTRTLRERSPSAGIRRSIR